MLTLACFVPHSPVLIPEVGKKDVEQLNDTIKAYQSLEHDLYSMKPDVILVISPHSEQRSEAFVINQSPKLKVDFKKFGDLVTKFEFKNDIGFGYQIKELVETEMPVVLSAQGELDYGAGVPLFFLAQHLPKTKVINISYSDLDNELHLEFGRKIRKQINLTGKRVAVVASGDLSHKLHEDSPAGYSPRGQEFDQKIIKLLADKDIKGLAGLDPELVKESGECGYKSLLILMGILEDINYQPEKMSYQSPFGIGYLVENFKM
ncbi:AmmeMemoRadiSam system protein B [Candidatus Parcubacteria bacterium]|nr:AmmeMemoRadiSam system protein B [Candidatus Parcubacteria bacterium]